MRHLTVLALACLVFLQVAPVQATFLPQELIRYDLLDKNEKQSDLTEAEFKSMLNRVQSKYKDVVSKHGGRLSISGSWTDTTLNAGARQMFGTWQVQITGGLARRQELTRDGFLLIVCHELGHHLGGFSLAPSPVPFMSVWAANEGQSDYFATQVCARTLWEAEHEINARYAETVNAYAKEKCNAVWATDQDRNLCYRVSVGVESVMNTMTALMKVPNTQFDTPDTTAVTETKHSHPTAQCRMDTQLQGAICKASWNNNIIPGKKVSSGPESIEAERQAAGVSCTKTGGYEYGLRPACWFKARL